MLTDFSKGMRTDKIDGLIKDTELPGTIEAKDNDYYNRGFPSVSAMHDRCYGCIDASVNKLFVKFVEHYKNVLGFGKDLGLSDCIVNGLVDQVQYFQCQAIADFRNYETLTIRTCKWHSLVLSVHVLRDVGNMHVHHAGLYHFCHQLFKTMYQNTSKKPLPVWMKL